jgi:hypothetical protein
MKQLRKTIVVLLILLGFSGVFVVLFAHTYFGAVLPRASDPSAGRIYQITVNHDQAFATHDEIWRIRIAEYWFFFCILCGLTGAIINLRFKDFTRRRKRSTIID